MGAVIINRSGRINENLFEDLKLKLQTSSKTRAAEKAIIFYLKDTKKLETEIEILQRENEKLAALLAKIQVIIKTKINLENELLNAINQ